MKTLNPWINFNGNAEEAFTFYKSAFGGEFTKIVRFKEVAPEGSHISDEDAEKIMLIELPIGTSGVLRANDIPSAMGTVDEHENRSKILVSTDSKEEADALFASLSAGGEVEGGMDQSPWGTYFGMFRDTYGIEWMIEFTPAG